MEFVKELAILCKKADGFTQNRYITNYQKGFEDPEPIKAGFKVFYDEYKEYLLKNDFSFLKTEKVKIYNKSLGQAYIPLSDVYQQFDSEKDVPCLKYLRLYLLQILVELLEIKELEDVLAKYKVKTKRDTEDKNYIDTKNAISGFENGMKSMYVKENENLTEEEFVMKAIKNQDFRNGLGGITGLIKDDPSKLGDIATSLFSHLTQKKK